MKKISFIVLLSLLGGSLSAQTMRVLFVGNSYTYVNDLPQTVADIALSKGDMFIFDSSAPGGYTLQQHCTDAVTLSKIGQQAWDYVVLQEQSQLPSFSPAQVATDVYPYAHRLDSLILLNDSCTETIFYMTWGRQNGDASSCSFYPPVCTYDGMQQGLRTSYMQMAADNHASVSPVGVAWKRVRGEHPEIDLYQADESHPSIYGTYLAACVFYSSFYHRSTVDADFVPAGISIAEALILQTIASETVLDSLALWQDTGDIPNADYSYAITSGNVQFANTSLNATTYNWDFGDSGSSALQDPLHTYSAAGNYAVTLRASNGCTSFTKTDSVFILSVGIAENSFGKTEMYPNPAKETVYIKTAITDYSVMITDVAGKTLLLKNNCTDAESLDVSGISAGLYFIHLQKGDQKTSMKLIISN